MKSASHLRFAILLLPGLLAGCIRAPDPGPLPAQARLPNPASVFCGENGGSLEIRTDASGDQVGICVFADGGECEEWAFFRNECRPAVSATSAAATPAPTIEPAPVPPAGWDRYTHPTLGYTFLYPAGSTFESTDTGRYTLVVGPMVNGEHWPWFNVAHPDLEDYHPPAEADLQAWLAEHNRLAGEVVGTRRIADVSAIHTRMDNGPQAYDDDRFYFVHDGQAYELTILHTGKEDWTVYDQFLDSFRF
jgi:putative hemolysin